MGGDQGEGERTKPEKFFNEFLRRDTGIGELKAAIEDLLKGRKHVT
jgi:hypothetical protein